MKRREEPVLLTALDALSRRMTLPYEEKQARINMKKGFIGEVQFDRLMAEHVDCETVVLQDLLLRIKGNSVQIDSLMLTPEVVYMYEIKNYDGDYVMKSGQLYTLASQEISNPLTQLNRASSLLRQLFQSWRINVSVEARIVFVNPAFVLYHAKPEDPVIFPGQIKAHFSQISRQHELQSVLSKRVNQLAKRLVEEHRSDVPFQKQLPAFEYDKLKRGMACGECGSFEVEMTQRTASCTGCKNVQSTDEAVMKQVNDFKLLFPDSKLTVKAIYDWCDKRISKNRIRKLLGKHYSKSSLSTGTHYI